MAGDAEFTLTQLLRESGKVLEAAEQGQDIHLKRRDGPDMMLVEADREEGIRQGLRTAASLILAVLGSSPAPEAMRGRAVDLMPWLSVLPDEFQTLFLREFARAAAAAVDTGEFTPLSRVTRDWKGTASLYSNPETRAWLAEQPTIDKEYVQKQRESS